MTRCYWNQIPYCQFSAVLGAVSVPGPVLGAGLGFPCGRLGRLVTRCLFSRLLFVTAHLLHGVCRVHTCWWCDFNVHIIFFRESFWRLPGGRTRCKHAPFCTQHCCWKDLLHLPREQARSCRGSGLHSCCPHLGEHPGWLISVLAFFLNCSEFTCDLIWSNGLYRLVKIWLFQAVFWAAKGMAFHWVHVPCSSGNTQ